MLIVPKYAPRVAETRSDIQQPELNLEKTPVFEIQDVVWTLVSPARTSPLHAMWPIAGHLKIMLVSPFSA